MGNCQAVDAAALVLQHPDGKIDRYYGPVSVSEIMRLYPGHYVSLIIPLPEKNIPVTTTTTDDKSERKVVRFTRVKLLRPTENLVLRAKKYAKTKKHQSETSKEKKKPSSEKKIDEESDKNQNLETKDEKQRSVLTNSASSRSKTWRPSLQSISEATS
ncbi:unnamed protein product [Arabidopsis thaliana]|uniref:(thale cress) hypothetical protein n=1 Tax=Arabidopsis thaliana TaxID=3702 RepID=A0A7G2DYT6_ARATH|nr:unnamed protein product [Arabidopsis thaliana]